MSEDPFDQLAPLAPLEPALPEGPPADGPSEAVLKRAAGLPLNDIGNGKRFVLHFGADCIYVPRVGWFIWDGRVWVQDKDRLAVRRNAQRLSDLIRREMPFLGFGAGLAEDRRRAVAAKAKSDRSVEEADDLDKLEKLFSRHHSFAISTGNTARIDNATREAEAELAVEFDALDAAPLDINTESGILRFSVVDMTEDGAGRVARVERVDHDRDLRMTKIMPVVLDPDAPHPLFDAFLERIQPDIEVRSFLQRWMGLSMTGQPLQRLVFLHGAGANGKSVLVDLMARIMGNYAATARIESLTGTTRRGGGDATPDLIPLMGARMVRTSEPDEGQRLQEGLIKELTGGEPLQVRALHSDFVEVRPHFKLTMSGNHKPEIRGTDDGIWRRVMMVPFDVQIPEAERDQGLIDKLWEERSGILNWLIEGLLDVLEGGLRPPAAVTEATSEYRMESDPIGNFLVDCCQITGDPTDNIAAKLLSDAFAYYLLERGMSPWKPTTFARQIAAKAGQWRHPKTGRQFTKGKSSVSQYLGMRFTDTFRHRFETAPKDHRGHPIGVSEASPDPIP
ncbi:MAG: hypothetical protein KDJ82_16200 [Rhodobacteraceae bacterium]|nr:hypothetical protein [Paracoccaceae bacterium]